MEAASEIVGEFSPTDLPNHFPIIATGDLNHAKT